VDEQALFEAMKAAGFEVALPESGACVWAGGSFEALGSTLFVCVEGGGSVFAPNGDTIGRATTPDDVVAACRAAGLRPDGSRDFLDEVIAEGGPGFAARVDEAYARRVMDDDGTLLPPLSPWAYILDALPDLRIDDDLAAALSRASQMSKGFWLAMQAQRDERVPPHPADTEAMSPEFWAAVSALEAAPAGAVVEGEAVENRPTNGGGR
jgi:hypothetical protein